MCPLLDLLHPYDASKMKMAPANPAVGNWRNNGPEMLDPP
jgi:putative SOS response-associated peptidase YedK